VAIKEDIEASIVVAEGIDEENVTLSVVSATIQVAREDKRKHRKENFVSYDHLISCDYVGLDNIIEKKS
jgi:hypothetical protein